MSFPMSSAGTPVSPLPIVGPRAHLPSNTLTAHLADVSDPHGVRSLVPALRTGSGVPSVEPADKATDLYFDTAGSLLYVMEESSGTRSWTAVASDSAALRGKTDLANYPAAERVLRDRLPVGFGDDVFTNVRVEPAVSPIIGGAKYEVVGDTEEYAGVTVAELDAGGRYLGGVGAAFGGAVPAVGTPIACGGSTGVSDGDALALLSDVPTTSEVTEMVDAAMAEIASDVADVANTAGNALSAAGNALSAAGNASSAANNALSAAGNALSTANNALSTANNASSAAGNALSTANNASSAAGNALSTANSALSAANEAKESARAADANSAAVQSEVATKTSRMTIGTEVDYDTDAVTLEDNKITRVEITTPEATLDVVLPEMDSNGYLNYCEMLLAVADGATSVDLITSANSIVYADSEGALVPEPGINHIVFSQVNAHEWAVSRTMLANVVGGADVLLEKGSSTNLMSTYELTDNHTVGELATSTGVEVSDDMPYGVYIQSLNQSGQ